MNILFYLILRNLKLYLRDKSAIFFSFLSVLILLTLYILFLGEMQSIKLLQIIGDVEGNDWIVSSWTMAAIITVSTITVPLGAIGNLINDNVDGIINDFYTSPINRKILSLSYLLSTWIIGFIMVMINLIIGQAYVLTQGGELFNFIQLIKMMGLIILSIMTFSSFFFYISMFLRSRNAYGTLTTIVGTFIGFLGGIYIPYSTYSYHY